MSSIDQLNIVGVRSFDHRGTGQNIDFKTPLTLIVGYNGSGKTTIIESLKYAATGEFPPNAAKGGAFIHDPKLTGDSEVLARVKMSFFNAQGHKLVVARRVSCTVKKDGGYTQKTLESSVAIAKSDGERQSISSTRIKMDEAVPRYMGVSPAILENVIFCHQEDSLWPMSEPSKLKEKFDQIFEAQKYTKAIDTLNKLKKNYANNLKVLENEEKHSKENNNKAKRVQKKIQDLSDAVEAKREKIEGMDREVAEAENVAKEKRGLRNEAEGIVNELDNKQQRAENIEYTLSTLRTNLQEREEPTSWLQSMLAEFHENIRKYTQQATDCQQQYKRIQDSLVESRGQLSRKQRDQGQHVAEKENHERNLQRRADLVRDAALRHSLRGYDGDLDEDTITEFVSRVQRMDREKAQDLTRLKEATIEQVRLHQDAMTEIQNRKAGRKQEKDTAKQQLAMNEKTRAAKQIAMDAITMDEGAKAVLDASDRESQDLLQNAQSAFELAGYSKRLSTEKNHLAELEGEYTRLSQELVQRTKTMNDTAALGIAQKEAQQAQRSLETLISTYSEQLNKAVGSGWTPRKLHREYQAALDQLEGRLADVKTQKEKADRVYHEHNFKLQTLKADLARKNAEMEKCNAALLGSITLEGGKAITTVEEYLRELKNLEEEREEAQKLLDSTSYVSDFYKKALKTVDQENCCRLCERTFANYNDKTSAKNKLNKLLEKYVKEELEKDLEEISEDFKKAQRVRPQYDIWKKLVDVDIPAVKKEIQNMEENNQALISRCEQQDEIVGREEDEKRDVSALRNTVNEIARLCAEISKQEERVARLSSQQKLSGSLSSVDDIQNQQEACREQINTAKGKIEKLSAERESARNEITDLERELGIISNKVNSAQHQLEKKQALSDAIKSLQDNNTQQRDLQKRADQDLLQMEPDLAKARAQRDDAQRRGDEKADILQADKNKLGQTVNQLSLIESSINNYIASGGPAKLAASDQAIKGIEEVVKRLEREQVEVTTKSNEIKGVITDSDNTKRSIQDNILYRKSLGDLEDVQRDIAELQSRNSREEYNRLDEEYDAASKHCLRLQAERSKLYTQFMSEDEQLGADMQEWDQDYSHVAVKWREDNVRVQTTRAAVSDLQKCTKALDKAIIQFHTVKMEEVNTIAAELWRSTYQGTDVDTIMIKSEDDIKTTATSTVRKYNYRVVMVKQDAELDMRGRCSAGQKVLASIIIRLALAESFGVACGVIALDEPTTNLDTDNIKALARSLNQIINNRKHQKNFQLIIITHDEAFIREMKCREFTDEYYRVSRNADQNSIIMKQDLSVIDED